MGINFLSWIDDLAQNSTFVGAMVTILYSGAAAILARVLVKIYNWGRMGKSEVVTQEQFKIYKHDLRETLIGWKDEVLKACLSRMDIILEDEIKKFKKMRDLEAKLEQTAVRLDEKMKYIEEKAERMSAIEDQVRILEAKLKNIQSQSGADTSADTMRRRAD